MCSKEEEEWPRPVRSLLIIFFMFDRNIMKWMCKKRVLGRRKTTRAEQVFHVSVLMYIMSRSIKWQKSQLAAAKERASGRGKHATSELESLAETFVSLGDFPVSAVLPQWMCTLFDQRGTAEAVPIEQNEEDETTEEKSRWRETFCIIALSPPPALCRFRRHALSASIRERCQSTCINLWLEKNFTDFYSHFF